MVPAVREAERRSLAEISAHIGALARKVCERKLQPTEWQCNSFTVSNLDMHGIDSFTAIINPPDSCILAVGAIVTYPSWKPARWSPGKWRTSRSARTIAWSTARRWQHS
jgi:pyruvate dehydrogenase E2 component (dihydrolipoamide acetyltransferase)